MEGRTDNVNRAELGGKVVLWPWLYHINNGM